MFGNGPLPSPGSNHIDDMFCCESGQVNVQPLAIMLDGDALHRNVVVRLESLGFPVVWHSTDSNLKSSLRGIRARTARHAAEIASHLMTSRKSRSYFCSTCKLSWKQPVEQPVGSQKVTFRTELASLTSKFDLSYARTCKTCPLITIIALSGDSAVETALNSLLAREPKLSSVYVDRILLAGSILLIIGPISDSVVSIALRRCQRIGVLLVVATPEGKPSNARAGTLHLWCASDSNVALQPLTPVFRALAASFQVVSNNVRDASSCRIARSIAANPDADLVASLLSNGLASAAASAERRSMNLVNELAEAKQSSHEKAKFKRIATAALDFALEAEARAVHIMQENSCIQQELDQANLQVKELISVCATMNQMLHNSAATINESKDTKALFREREHDISRCKLTEEILERELTSACVLFTQETELHCSLRNKIVTETESTNRLCHQIAVLKTELTELRDTIRAKDESINDLSVSFIQELALYSNIYSELHSHISFLADYMKNMQEAVEQVIIENKQVEGTVFSIRQVIVSYRKFEHKFVKYRQAVEDDAAKIALLLKHSTKNEWLANSHAKQTELNCTRLERALDEARKMMIAADNHAKNLHRAIESSEQDLKVMMKAKLDAEVAAASVEANNTVAVADRARIEAEARSLRAGKLLVECENRKEQEMRRTIKLSRKLIAMKSKFLLGKSNSASSFLLQTKLSSAYDDIKRLVHEVTQLEQQVSALYDTRDRKDTAFQNGPSKLSEARAEYETPEYQVTAQDRSFRVTLDVQQLCEQLFSAKISQASIQAALKLARKNLNHFDKAQTVASEACAALAEFNTETSCLSYTIDAARSIRASQKADQFFHRAITSAREEGTVQIALRETKSKMGT